MNGFPAFPRRISARKSRGRRVEMNHFQGVLTSKATPVPEINTQVVNELKDTVESAKDVANTFVHFISSKMCSIRFVFI